MKRKVSDYIVIALLVLFSVICIYPLLYLLFYSLKTNNEIFFTNPFGPTMNPQFDNYVRAVNAFDLPVYFRNSILVTLVSVFGILVLALPFAYATTRMTWKLKNAAVNYLTLGLFIPTQVIIIPLAILVKKLHIANTYFALIIPYIAFNLAFTSMVISTSFRSLPKEMEESAFLDGASVTKTFLHIMVPLVKPAISTALIFAFLNIWNEYTLASILISKPAVKTLPIGLSSFVGQHSTDWGAMGACFVISSIPTIAIYLIFSEQVEKALTIGGAVKG
ncbi:MAG: carbohydrate ABC transporter permease [Eubacteriales bacterium]|nr:carbohydrate ABC transporter permease [Eubacteriales bacterium]